MNPERVRRPDLRALCRALWPAWLKVKGLPQRYQVFLRSIERIDGQPTLLIEGAELPVGPVVATIELCDRAEREVWLSGSLSRREDGEARFVIRSGPAFRPVRGSRLRPRAHAAAVAFNVQQSAHGRLCMPVIDIDARTVRIDSSVRLVPGVVLTDVAISVDQRELRRCQGVVTKTTEVVLPTGRVRYHCVARLQAGSPVAGANADDGAAIVKPPRRVVELLWAMCDFRRPLMIRRGERTAHGHIESAAGSRSGPPRVTCVTTDGAFLSTPGTVRVTCVMFGSAFEFFAHASTTASGELSLVPAPVLRERFRRASARTDFPPHVPACIEFRHPLSRAVWSSDLVEMGFGGLSFTHEHAETLFWPGLPLANVRVRIGETSFRLRQTKVRAAKSNRIGVCFDPPAGPDGDRLRGLLLQLAGSPARLHDAREFADLMTLHQESGLLEPDMEAYLAAHRAEIAETWSRAHQFPDGLMRTVVVPWKDRLGASLTSVRSYERTWFLQHSSVLSPAVNTGAGLLHSTLMALASARSDGEYIAGFVDAAARSLHGMVDSFMKADLAEHRGGHEFILYSAESEESETPETPALRRLRKRDEQLVHNVARRYLDPVCANALSLNAGEVELPATRAAYRRLGLERGREAWGAFANDRCLGVLLQEYASPGLSLSGLLSAAMLFPLRAQGQQDLALQEALCRLARRLRLPGLSPVRFLFVPSNVPASPIRDVGFAPIGRCSLFAFHRLSLEAYNRHVENRYGLLRARLENRAKKAV